MVLLMADRAPVRTCSTRRRPRTAARSPSVSSPHALDADRASGTPGPPCWPPPAPPTWCRGGGRCPGLVVAHRRRGHDGTRDVSDPYKRGDRAFDRMAAELDPAVRTIVTWERQFPR